MPLTKGQQKAYELMCSGENVFLTGEAGTGKSYVLQEFIERQRAQDKNVVVCAPSGIAAINVGGSTIHRTFKAPFEPAISRPGKVPSVITSADTIIIDEISMCRIDLFDFIAQTIIKANQRRSKKDEKDIQLIVVGDFCQLPPVVTDKDRKVLTEHYRDDVGNGYAFQSGFWGIFQFRTAYLQEIMRQSDKDFIDALNRARMGDASCIDYFNKNSCKNKLTGGIELCATNKQAQEINQKGLLGIRSVMHEYHAEESGEVNDSDRPAEQVLNLKEGARVMLLTNDAEDKWQNGSIGTINDLKMNSISIELDNGKMVEIVRHRWIIEKYIVDEEMCDGELQKVVRKEEIGRYEQFPLKLAYAITMHKSQGQTYDQVNISPAAWAPGQLYVALSRAKTIKKMHLTMPILPQYLVAAKEVVDFYHSLNNECNYDVNAINSVNKKNMEKEVDEMIEPRNFEENTDTELQEELIGQKQKTKTTSFRLTEETADKFKEFLEKIPGSREDAFIDLMDVYELHHSKSLVPDREKEINSFQIHANALVAAYTRSLEICAEAEDSIKKSYDYQITSKDKIIADYQEKYEEAKVKFNEIKNELDEFKAKLALAEKEAEDAKEKQVSAEQKAADKVEIANMLQIQLKEATDKVVEYPTLKETEAFLRGELAKSEQTIKDNQKDAEIAQERAVAAKDREIAAAKLDAEKELMKLEKEKNTENQVLRDKIDRLKDEISELKLELSKLR